MRTIAQEWQTLATARAGSALNEGEYHTYAVEVKGSAMRGCLDDVPLLYSNALSAYSEGGLGSASNTAGCMWTSCASRCRKTHPRSRLTLR